MGIRLHYWQKTAVCELGCGYYRKREDGTEACTLVGYRLHPDWCEVAMDCDDFKTEAQIAAEKALKAAREKQMKRR